MKIYLEAIQCTDSTSNKVGDFLFHKVEGNKLVAASPVFDSLPDLFKWIKDSNFVLVLRNGLMPWYMDKQDLEALYLEWVNDWLTPAAMAEHHGISESELKLILDVAKQQRES